MPFRATFDCLWGGRPWAGHAADDLEGWAGLCPDCLGKADDNGFLRGRLRSALRERAAAAASTTPAAVAPGFAPGDWEDWYLRRGRFSRGPVYDGPWAMELEGATRWLDGLPLSGVIVELGAGMGWWTGLLAEKGELWLYDSDDASLDAARKRLLAHGLLAHLHQRDPLATPDKPVDAVFAAHLLSTAETVAGLEARLAVARAWLKPGGSFVFVDVHPADVAGPIAGPAGPLWPHAVETLRGAALRAGFASVEIEETRSAFVLGRAAATVSTREHG